MYRIVGVLQQIGRSFVNEGVWNLMLLFHVLLQVVKIIHQYHKITDGFSSRPCIFVKFGQIFKQFLTQVGIEIKI